MESPGGNRGSRSQDGDDEPYKPISPNSQRVPRIIARHRLRPDDLTAVNDADATDRLAA